MKVDFLLQEYITKNGSHAETHCAQVSSDLSFCLRDIAEKTGPRETETGSRY